MNADPTNDESTVNPDPMKSDSMAAAQPMAGAAPLPGEQPAPADQPPAAEGPAPEATSGAATEAQATDAQTAVMETGATIDVDAAPTTAAALAAPLPAAVPGQSARARAASAARHAVRLGFAVVLFGIGAYFGAQVFRANQPVTAPAGDPAVAGVPAPAVVVELANAIAAGDSDAVRSAMSSEVFDSYTADLEQFGIVRVDAVDTLGTYEDGGRTATALLLHGRDLDNNPFNINLVVLTEGGTIVRLR